MFDQTFSHLIAGPKGRERHLLAVRPGELKDWKKAASKAQREWITSAGFDAAAGAICALPEADGKVKTVLAGLGADEGGRIWDWAKVFDALPAGDYKALDAAGGSLPADEIGRALLGRLLSGYRFDRFKSKPSKAEPARIKLPADFDKAGTVRTARGVWTVRDLINLPAGDLGPTALAAAAKKIAKRFKARCSVVVGDDLLKKKWPAVHAVGRASSDAPRLIDIRWGNARHPKVTLVGKGVCFDSGGLDIKSAAGMKLMKKDMGGAAHMLALGAMIMDAKLPVRLRVLVPAVENSIAGNAMRPLDVVPTRSGLTIEIGHTDAEGRVILADALYEAASEKPEVIIDCATLTGAARIALGTEVPALFSNDDGLAADLLMAGGETGDAVWRLPLWAGYDRAVDGKVADVTNSPEGGYGGAITAALFLQRFVSAANKKPAGADQGSAQGPAWAHFDMMAWNTSSKPGRPEGGEAMGLRAMFACLETRYRR